MQLELIRPREQLTEMVGWCDGSWADLDEKRMSTTGVLLMRGGACVAGWSRTQKPTALSSGESEFDSATVCACELLWASDFFKSELGYTMTTCLKEDASACIGMATRLDVVRLKHVEIKHFWQHWVRQGRLTLDKVTTTRAVGRHHDKNIIHSRRC